MASSFKVWPPNPHRVPFWDAQSLLQKFMAHAVTPTTALGELAAYGQKWGRKVRGWQSPNHRATQTTYTTRTTQGHNHFVYASRNILQSLFRLGIINSHRNHHHHQSSQFSGDIWMVDSRSSRLCPGCPRVSTSCLSMCVTYAQPPSFPPAGNYLCCRKTRGENYLGRGVSIFFFLATFWNQLTYRFISQSMDTLGAHLICRSKMCKIKIRLQPFDYLSGK